MATMHFHIAQTGLVVEIYYFNLEGPREQFGNHKKLFWSCKVGQIRCRVQGTLILRLFCDMGHPRSIPLHIASLCTSGFF